MMALSHFRGDLTPGRPRKSQLTIRERTMKKLMHRSGVFAFSVAIVVAAQATAMAQYRQYRWDDSEGGWVDKKHNLVWGLDYRRFMSTLPDGTTDNVGIDQVDWTTAQTLAANYPEVLATAGWLDAANIAAHWEDQGLHWRQPTVAEATTAWNAGFLSRAYTESGGNEIRWTSSFKNKNGVFAGAYAIYLLDGSITLAEATRLGFPLFVRPYR